MPSRRPFRFGAARDVAAQSLCFLRGARPWRGVMAVCCLLACVLALAGCPRTGTYVAPPSPTYHYDQAPRQPEYQRRREHVRRQHLQNCNVQFNNCMVTCNAIPEPNNRALCVNNCNVQRAQCQSLAR